MTQFNLGDLQKLVKRLEADLRTRSQEVAEVREPLEKEYEQARAGQRTVETYGSWRDAYLTQSAVAWVLSCVFVRYLEDNGRIDEVWLAGEGERMQEANERHADYFRQNPLHSDRDYFQFVFRQIAKLPGCSELLAEDRNPLWRVGISGDGARELLEFWQSRDEKLKRSFQSGDTRFLGDLYQDLSQDARKRYALLQTPEFVEEFILDYTLKPAIQEFGIEGLRLIDPACGSGHFLLGAFQRLLNEWQRTTNSRDAAGKALASVRGIDVNPFAVAIARFRLAMAFVDACEVRRLRECPEFHPQVFCGDSLLHGVTLTNVRGQHMFDDYPPDGLVSGDYDDARRVLMERYHVVVANPPYITDSDKVHNALVRARYRSCHRKFSLSMPFFERCFHSCVPSGFWGFINSNAFMKREFGSVLIENVLSELDLTHIIDTSAAHIPGHGTPTVILFGRNRRPVSENLRAVLGIRGEPSPPQIASEGLVWNSIVSNIESPGVVTEFISVDDLPRKLYQKHPWPVGGGGATDMLSLLKEQESVLADAIDSVGFLGIPNADDMFLLPPDVIDRYSLESDWFYPLATGDEVRDWTLQASQLAFFPYNSVGLRTLEPNSNNYKFFWPYRRVLESRTTFDKTTYKEEGLPWWRWHQVVLSRLQRIRCIVFAFVSTHNHFVLEEGDHVFTRTAPMIQLAEDRSSHDDTLELLGVLNSSTFCFWSQQIMHCKGGPGGASSKDEKWHDFYEFDGGKLKQFPLPKNLQKLIEYSQALNAERQNFLCVEADLALLPQTTEELERMELARFRSFCRSVALQEELDWACLHCYGLSDLAPLNVTDLDRLEIVIRPGERAFEILGAAAILEDNAQTRWYERKERSFCPEIPVTWPVEYSHLVSLRLEELRSKPFLQLIESMNCKRRWELPEWKSLVASQVVSWLLRLVEAMDVWRENRIIDSDQVLDRLSSVPGAREAIELAFSDKEMPVALTEILRSEGVPYLSVATYSESGLRKREDWLNTWILQRREDAGETLVFPVPPKYAKGDFVDERFWKLRGKPDIPKERFILYPGAERDNDRSLVVGWAGWDHLQRAMALAAYYNERKENDGWDKDRLRPLLAGLAELVPWLKQWHNEVHPEYGERLGDFYEVFVTEEARSFGLTWEDLRQTPNPQAPRTRKRK